MPKALLWLALAVIASSLLVIETRHESRLLYTQLQQLQAGRDTLNTEWGQLLLEEGTWAEHRRVEAMARARLDMNLPGRDQIVVVTSVGGGK
jgi:cell division protein FtsL